MKNLFQGEFGYEYAERLDWTEKTLAYSGLLPALNLYETENNF